MTEVASRRLYFAHPVNTYNKPLESAVIQLVRDLFPGDVVENPNQPHHQVGYAKFAERAKMSATHKGMNYFYDEVLPSCGGCVALPFLDGKMGLGVAGEVHWFVKRNLPVWVIMPRKDTTPERLAEFSRNPNPQTSPFYLRELTPSEISSIVGWDQKNPETYPCFILPHLETRLRTWLIYNVKGQERSYEEAHLVSMPLPPGFYPDKS